MGNPTYKSRQLRLSLFIVHYTLTRIFKRRAKE